MLTRKNEQLVQEELEKRRTKEDEDRKWHGVPEWKKSLTLDKQKKLQQKNVGTGVSYTPVG